MQATENFDVLVVGAGISGISAAHHLQKHCPNKSFAILERRQAIGGTWDLFNYPGIRSDSDMYTFGYSFRPWKDKAAIAEKDKILNYLEETVDELDVRDRLLFGVHVRSVKWISERARWLVVTEIEGGERHFECQFIFMGVGYYNYDQAYSPQFEGADRFGGQIIHPQFWPEQLDYTDKKIAVIGSGATAITLIPSLAETADHVTMVQRSPTYIGAKPLVDPKANWLAKWVGHWAARWWFILFSMFIYYYCKLFPNQAKRAMLAEIKQTLGDKYKTEDFSPSYNPWDQRLCLVPDGDLFEAIKADKASMATGRIDTFTETGLRLQDGRHVEADIIVTATGLEMQFLGGIDVWLDEQLQNPHDLFVYKGLMCNDVPNLFACVGYTNASWTLKVDLTNRYACRLINYIEQNGLRSCRARTALGVDEAPLLDLHSGYIQRAIEKFPQQGKKAPWKLYQNYILDSLSLRFAPLKDEAMEFS